MMNLKAKYKDCKKEIESTNYDGDEFLIDWFDSQDYVFKDGENEKNFYILSIFGGWAYYDTCIKIDGENALIGYFNDQKNIFTPIYKINNNNWRLAMHETLENMDVMDSIKLKTNDALMEV